MKIVPKISLFLVILIVLSMSLLSCTKKTNGDVQITTEDIEGKLLVKVLDKSTKNPVNDAKIVVLGVENMYKTDENGQSPEITLKINKEFYDNYGGNLSKKAPSGSATVLISKDGYKDYIVFNKSIYPGYASNSLNIELAKVLKSDKQKYIASIDLPHEVWMQDLIQYCKEIKEDKDGSGENKVTINVKDDKSKAIEGVSLVIPELGIKCTTDKSGKASLKVSNERDVFDTYPVKKNYLEHTIVALKEGYASEVLLNAAIYKEKDNVISISLKTDKAQGQNNFTVKCQPFESVWVEKLIANYKKTGTE